MAAESFGGALLLFRSGQIFLAGGDGPTHSERIAQVPVAVAPELVGDRHGDFATGRDSLRPGCVGVGNVEVEMKRAGGPGRAEAYRIPRQNRRRTPGWNRRCALAHASICRRGRAIGKSPPRRMRSSESRFTGLRLRLPGGPLTNENQPE